MKLYKKIVNINKIRFVSEEHRLYFITLDDESIRKIPVSKSYYDSIYASLNMAQKRGEMQSIVKEA